MPVFLLTLAWAPADSFGMQKAQRDNTFEYVPFQNNPYLWQQQLPPIPTYVTHNMRSQFVDFRETSSSHINPQMQVFNNCTFNFAQQEQYLSPKRERRGKGGKTLMKEKTKAYASFDMDKAVSIAKEKGESDLFALLNTCSQHYIDLTKDEATETSDQESDKHSDSDESVEEVLETRGETQYSLRNVERVHWGTTTIHEISEVKSAFISADENPESEDEVQTKKKPKVIKKNKLKVPQKRAKKSSSGRKITTPTRLADMEMVGTQYVKAKKVR